MGIAAGKILLAGIFVFGGALASMPCRASDGTDEQSVIVNEDGRFEYPLEGKAVAAGVATAGGAEAHCSYLPAVPGASARTVRFADGNEAAFSAGRVQFIPRDGARTRIDDGAEVTGKSWWCQADSVVLFRTLASPGGRLDALKVELFSSKGEPITVTLVHVPPHGNQERWSYEHSRLVDECLGMTFRITRDGKPGDSLKDARFIEYRLCPKGI